MFLVLTLWIIEGFETHVRTFLLSVKLGEGTSTNRAAVERLLQRAHAAFELRTTGDDELCLPGQHRRVGQDRGALGGTGRAGSEGEKTQIEWKEEKKARPLEKDEDDD